MTTWREITELNDLNKELEKESMKGLWTSGEEIIRAPKPFGPPKLWKWSKIREGLDAAARLIPTNYMGARRVLQLVHPNMAHGTSKHVGDGRCKLVEGWGSGVFPSAHRGSHALRPGRRQRCLHDDERRKVRHGTWRHADPTQLGMA